MSDANRADTANVNCSNDISVLIVEDEDVVAQAHTLYVERVDGFCVAGVAATAQQALQVLNRANVDLVLLDMNLPDYSGLSIVQRLRAAGHLADVIAVTSVREVDTVRSARSLGIVHYILKPFVFATLRERLEAYAAYRAQWQVDIAADTQSQVDSLFARLPAASAPLPKGMTEDLLSRVCECLRAGAGGASSQELADMLGVSRVTARRYAEHLVEVGRVSRGARYLGTGRPQVTYTWKS